MTTAVSIATPTVRRRRSAIVALLWLASWIAFSQAFTADPWHAAAPTVSRWAHRQKHVPSHHRNQSDDDSNHGVTPILSRRTFGNTLASTVAAALCNVVLLSLPAVSPAQGADDSSYFAVRPAPRPLAYRIDSTIPPTLLPLSRSQQQTILARLGRGSGTDKNAIVVDTINLNNMLNKAVFGTASAVTNAMASVGSGNNNKNTVTEPSFVCLGLPLTPSSDDMASVSDIIAAMTHVRKNDDAATAIGLTAFPMSVQSILDHYWANDGGIRDDDLHAALHDNGVNDVSLYVPIVRQARKDGIAVLALGVNAADVQAVRQGGLQKLDPARRAQYVVDPDGFVQVTNDPKFKLYADRSLFKDLRDVDAGNFFAERILAHEAAATVAATYAAQHDNALVIVLAPVADVRFLQGLNGRLPRVASQLLPTSSSVTDNRVTTILINPTAAETLSLTRYLRLEIGTGPDTLAYQSKLADFLWFSRTPPVHLLPRLMDA